MGKVLRCRYCLGGNPERLISKAHGGFRLRCRCGALTDWYDTPKKATGVWNRQCGISEEKARDRSSQTSNLLEAIRSSKKTEKEDPELCENCQYWWKMDEEEGEECRGWCHRYPPLINPLFPQRDVLTPFPITMHFSWCGEWKPTES